MRLLGAMERAARTQLPLERGFVPGPRAAGLTPDAKPAGTARGAGRFSAPWWRRSARPVTSPHSTATRCSTSTA
ncbi:hypothetical protein ACTMU2_40110 [Cupriavidus basilensis]